MSIPVVTAMRDDRRGRVAVELDGAPWRTVPAGAVAAARLSVGTRLDRSRARELRRALRRAEALGRAARALARRDLTERSLDLRLQRSGIAPATRRDALGALADLGLVDDARFARARAAALAARGYGDAAIRFDLERQGIARDLAADALDEIPLERERAERLAELRGRHRVSAAFLARRGFADETVDAVVDIGVANEP